MIIAIDISMLVYAGSGVSRYTFDLCESLLTYHPENTYKLFYSSRRRPADTTTMLNALRNLGALIYDFPFPPWFMQLIWNQYALLSPSLLMGKFDVFHSSDFLRPPLSRKVLSVTTLHDLTWLLFPELHDSNTVILHQHKLERTVANNDHIIVDSINTRTDLRIHFPEISKKLISVIPLGINKRFQHVNVEHVELIKRKYSVPELRPYILYVGAIEPRKRLGLCVDVFDKFLEIAKMSDFNFIIAGRAGWKNEELFNKIKMMNLQERVKFIGYVDDLDLPAIYSGASASLYLSMYEGFGLPPLESLSCGTPVLTSSTSSVSEFVPSKYLSESLDPDELAEQLAELIKCKSNETLIDDDRFKWKQYTDTYVTLLTNNLNSK